MSNLLRVTGTVVNVRRGPKADAKVVAQARAGNLIEARPVASEGPWLAVWTDQGEPGWIHGAYVTQAGPSTAPATAPVARKWRVANSLERLLSQINERAPKRSKAYDGSIGDEAHQERKSDHNPVKPPAGVEDKTPVVLARDFTHDPKNGADAQVAVDKIVASEDKRVSYLIFKRRIWRSYDRKASATRPFLKAWSPERYTGPNPHDHHFHVSVVASPALYDDTRDWNI